MSILIQAEEIPRKYFTQIPNIVDDFGLDPFTFRLYSHLRRVAGETGKCWQSTKTLADHCKMSAGRISKSKQALLDAQLIRLTEQAGPGGQHHVITIVDVWQANNEFFRSPDEHEERSPGEHEERSPGEGKPEERSQDEHKNEKRSPGETKKNHIHEEELNHEEEQTCLAAPGDDFDSGDLTLYDDVALVDGKIKPLPTLHAGHWFLPVPLCRISSLEGEKHAMAQNAMVTCTACRELIQAGPPRDDQMLFEALAHVAQWDLEAMTADQRGQINQTAGVFRKMRNQTVVPADVLAFADWFRDHHHHGQDPPRPDQVRKEWGRFRNWQANQGAMLKAALDSQSAQADAQAKAQEIDPKLQIATKTWREACMQLQGSLPSGTYNHYIKPLTVLQPNGVFRLQAPTPEVYEWVTGRLHKKIAGALEAAVGRPVELEVIACQQE